MRLRRGRLSQNVGGTSEPIWDWNWELNRMKSGVNMTKFAVFYGSVQVKAEG